MLKIILNLRFLNSDSYETDEQVIEIDLPNQFNDPLIDLSNFANLIAFYKELVCCDKQGIWQVTTVRFREA